MERRLIQLFLFSGFLSVILCSSRKYILIQEYKTWAQAQEYCRQNNMDLATVQTDEEWIEFNKSRAGLQFNTWIGLYDDVNTWRWSYLNENITFVNWGVGWPDNYVGNQNCAALFSLGYWNDFRCDLRRPFICQNGREPVLVTDPVLSWNEAQSYCRVNYTDLITVRSTEENLRLFKMIPSGMSAWFGLFRDSWKWSDQTRSSPSPQRWAPVQPDNKFPSENCAAVNAAGQIADEQCSKLFFFFCHVHVSESLTTGLKQQSVLRLEVKAGDDVNDPAVRDAMLKEVQKKLREQGMPADVKVVWREQPDGKVFQKIK